MISWRAIAVVLSGFVVGGQTIEATETVQMWYESSTGDLCPVNSTTGELEPVTGTGATCELAIEDGYNKLIAACTSHSSWMIVISGDCLTASESAMAYESQPEVQQPEKGGSEPPEHYTTSQWDAMAAYWCPEDDFLSPDGSSIGESSPAAAIIAAIDDLKSQFGSGEPTCGGEDPPAPVVKVTELNENPAGGEEWVVAITYEFGNGEVYTRVGRGKTYWQADANAWREILKLAAQNGGVRKGYSRVRTPNGNMPPRPKPLAAVPESPTAK